MTRYTHDVRRRLEVALDDMQESGEAPRDVLRHAADLNILLAEFDRMRAALGVNEG